MRVQGALSLYLFQFTSSGSRETFQLLWFVGFCFFFFFPQRRFWVLMSDFVPQIDPFSCLSLMCSCKLSLPDHTSNCSVWFGPGGTYLRGFLGRALGGLIGRERHCRVVMGGCAHRALHCPHLLSRWGTWREDELGRLRRKRV